MKFGIDLPDGYDEEPPRPGDFLEPVAPARAWYRVERIRPVESKIHPNRWMLDVHRIDPPVTPDRFDLDEGCRVIRYEWTPRT